MRSLFALLPLTPAPAIVVGNVTPAHAGDGLAYLASEPTYYETVLSFESPEAFSSAEPGLPSALAVDTAEGISIEYRSTPIGDLLKWELAVDGFRRSHERVGALYQIVLIVPLPVDEAGKPIWRALEPAMKPRMSLDPDAPPVLYRGKPVKFKRNVALEKTWLPELVGADGGQLSDLSGSGYYWTLWDTLLLHDPNHGDEVAGALQFYYETPHSVVAPDASDERFGFYVVTWIPKLTREIAPYAVRAPISPPES